MSCDGEVFSVSKTVEHYLGFHQVRATFSIFLFWLIQMLVVEQI